MRALTVLTGCLLLWRATVVGQRTASPLTGVRVELDSVTSGQEYLVYAYRVANPVESKGGAAAFSIDLSAPRGTGFLTLPATGRFMHGPGFPSVNRSQFREHVPVGPISPSNWMAFLVKDGGLDWFGARGGLSGQFDSIAPGDSLGGFGLRSPFLPGIRPSSADPTFASCCTNLRSPGQSSEPEYPNPSEFRVHGWTVAPTYRPDQMTLGVMAELLDRSCRKLAWVSPREICQILRAKLGPGGSADAATVKRSLRAFLEQLDTQHGGVEKHVSDNAYWLLKVNGEYLLAHM